MQAPSENSPAPQHSPSETAQPKRNRGWFHGADPRINRNGRPRGSKAGPADADRAPSTDRLMLLVLSAAAVTFRLTRERAFWLLNAPQDMEIVGSRLDAARGVVVFVVRSETFPRVARGAVIPPFGPEFNGLWWHKSAGRPLP